MNFRHLLAAALIAPLTLLSGCSDTDAERTVEDVTGIDEGTETSTTGVDEQDFIVTTEKTIEYADTGEVVSKKVEKTPVSVVTEKEVSTDVNVKAGDTSTESTGTAPEGIDDN